MVRFDIIRDITPIAVAAGGASQHAGAELLSTPVGAAPAELLSTRPGPCARSNAAPSRTHWPEANPETEPVEEADYDVEDSDESISDERMLAY